MIDTATHKRTARGFRVKQPRTVQTSVCQRVGKINPEWRVLESGVLAIKTTVQVVTEKGIHRVWYDPVNGGRFVCPHGWGQWHLSTWNGPRALLFPKPTWTTCDCRTATGLCARKKQRCPCEKGAGGHIERADSVPATAPSPGYYDVLMATHGANELRPGLCGVRVPGVYGRKGEAFYMVKGDVSNVLRCSHGQTTNTLNAQARERRSRAASLVAAALCGRRLAFGTLGGTQTRQVQVPDRGTARALVCLLLTLHATREARRTRRGVPTPCGCTPVHVKARMTRCR